MARYRHDDDGEDLDTGCLLGVVIVVLVTVLCWYAFGRLLGVV